MNKQSTRGVEQIAKDSFQEIGRLLKLLRKEDDDRIHRTRLASLKELNKKDAPKEDESDDSVQDIEDKDPANVDKELGEKLKENEKKAKEQEKKVGKISKIFLCLKKTETKIGIMIMIIRFD